MNVRLEWVPGEWAYAVVCSDHGVVPQTYAGSERIEALNGARDHLLAEHPPGGDRDEWLVWVDREREVAMKMGWGR